jgi:hypothetical protein
MAFSTFHDTARLDQIQVSLITALQNGIFCVSVE